MREPKPLRTLDQRKWWARVRSPIWVVLGALFAGGAAAGAGLVLLGALAYGWSRLLDRSIRDFPLWGWAGEVAVVLGGVVGVVLAATIVLYGLFGAPTRLLDQVGARVVEGPRPDADLDPGATFRFRNVVEELSLGLGEAPPRLALIDDTAPNALSVRHWRRRTIVATTGLLTFPRDEVEAVLAHELAHLHASDARWITAAESSVARAHGITDLIVGAGLLITTLGFAADVWFSVIVVGVLLAIIGVAGRFLAGRVLTLIRAESDQLADVAAILLGRNPESLGNVCARLADDSREVVVKPRAARLLWFKLVADDDIDDAQSDRELDERADAAYREARIPRPLPPPMRF